jgi:membrane protease YdiL (CAAX protease family)
VAATLVAGAALLWGTFHTARGEVAFWLVGFGLAAVWIFGGLVAAPVHLGRRGPVVLGGAAGLGAGAFAVVYLAYRLLRDVPVLSGALDRVVGTAHAAHVGAVVALAVVNALAEEVFFRGALVSTLGRGDPRRTVLVSSAVYGLVTVASLNVALVIAAVGMGAVFALVAWVARGVLAPAVCHVTWSVLMLVALHR